MTTDRRRLTIGRTDNCALRIVTKNIAAFVAKFTDLIWSPATEQFQFVYSK